MKRALSLLITILMLLSAASCGNSQTAQNAEASEAVETAQTAEGVTHAEADATGGDYRILRAGIVDTTSSFAPVSDGNTLAKNMVYDGLLRMDADGNLYPWAAESVEITDGAMIVKLKDNVYFDNGEQMTGEDVVYSFYVCATNASNPFGSKYASINFDETTVSEDGLTVTFKLDYVFEPLIYYIGKIVLLDKSACEDWASDEPRWWDDPVSSGAYEILENVDGSHCTLRLREDYWNIEAMPEWDEVIINYYSNATAMFIAFENDELDIAMSLDEKDFARLLAGDTANADHAACAALVSGGTHHLILDPYCEYFDDPKVREAVAHAIDYDSLMDAVYGTLGKTGVGSMCGSNNVYYEYQGEYAFDLDYARQCMAESAYPDGFACNIVSMSHYSTEWEILQAELSEIGIDLKISLYDNPTCIQMYMQEGATDMSLNDTEAGSRHPAECLGNFNATNFVTNSRILDPKYNTLYDASTSTTDKEAVGEIYHEMQKWFYDTMHVIVLGEVAEAIAWNSDVCSSTLYSTKGDFLAWAVTPVA